MGAHWRFSRAVSTTGRRITASTTSKTKSVRPGARLCRLTAGREKFARLPADPEAHPKDQQLSSAEEKGERHTGREQKGNLAIGSELRLDGVGGTRSGCRRRGDSRLQPRCGRSPAGSAEGEDGVPGPPQRKRGQSLVDARNAIAARAELDEGNRVA